MILVAANMMCTAVVEPREWEMEGRSGTTYKVELSDGKGSIELQCADDETYYMFAPFERYNVSIDLRQTNYEGRKGVKALIVNAGHIE